MGEAGAALDLGAPGISGLVDRMTAANLIRRRADPDDGRAWRLWLTPAGRAALAQSKAGLAEINARLTEGFTDAEIDVVAPACKPDFHEEKTNDRAYQDRQ
jgi:DNA-binding MarR family transcriptional regulator